MFVSHPNMLNPTSPCDSVRGLSLLGHKLWVLIDGISVLKNKNFIELTPSARGGHREKNL